MQKNQPYINRSGTAAVTFANLIDLFYYHLTPENFQKKYASYTAFYNRVYNGYFLGIFAYAFIARRLYKKSVWFRLTKSNSFMMKSIFMIWGTIIVINEFYIQGLKKICMNNIDIVDAVFDSHLKLISAHGVDINKAM